MIKNKNNWYLEAQIASQIIHEAGIKDSWKGIAWAIALLLTGVSIEMASQKTGVPAEQISQAVQNPQLVEKVKQQMNNTNQVSTPQVNTHQQEIQKEIQQEPSQSDIQKIDFSGIENLIRLHEVSGEEREVTVNGEKIDIRKVYPDPIYGMKVPTIGVGYNLNRDEARKEIESLGLDYDKVRNGTQMLTDEQVNLLYRNDIGKSIADARKFLPNFSQQPKQVQTVLVDMAFNLGLTRLNKFKKFRKALLNFDYDTASKEMIDSKWYRQVGERAKRNVETIRNTKPVSKPIQNQNLIPKQKPNPMQENYTL